MDAGRFPVACRAKAWLRYLITLFCALGTSSSPALTPLPDTRPGFFAGDWIGTGADDQFCFIRLLPDGNGTVLLGNASGDWQGARIRWRNENQRLQLIESSPLPAEPRRRLQALSRLTVQSGINRTLQLKLADNLPPCELQLRDSVLRRGQDAAVLLDMPTTGRAPDARP